MVWGSFLISAAALKTFTRNCSNDQGVNLTFHGQFVSWSLHDIVRQGRGLTFTRYCYCHYQHCIVCGIYKAGRGRVVYSAYVVVVQLYCNPVGNAGGRGQQKDDCFVRKRLDVKEYLVKAKEKGGCGGGGGVIHAPSSRHLRARC